jgi:hypothetical protein
VAKQHPFVPRPLSAVSLYKALFYRSTTNKHTLSLPSRSIRSPVLVAPSIKAIPLFFSIVATHTVPSVLIIHNFYRVNRIRRDTVSPQLFIQCCSRISKPFVNLIGTVSSSLYFQTSKPPRLWPPKLSRTRCEQTNQVIVPSGLGHWLARFIQLAFSLAACTTPPPKHSAGYEWTQKKKKGQACSLSSDWLIYIKHQPSLPSNRTYQPPLSLLTKPTRPAIPAFSRLHLRPAQSAPRVWCRAEPPHTRIGVILWVIRPAQPNKSAL